MQQPVVTIFCAFTRYWAINKWLESLASMKHDPALTNLAIIIDIDDPRILNRIRKYAEDHGYRKFVFKMNEGWSPNEVRISARRLRIADVKNQSKDLIAQTDGEFVMSFEDDTVFTNLDIMRLIAPMMGSAEIGYVQGVQCGRWGVKMIGAWVADNFKNPQVIQTILPGESYEEISGGGMYGYVTRRELYLNAEYYASSAQPWGPDVNYGLWLRNRGYKCLIDWESVFGHYDHNQIIWPHTGKPLAWVKFTKNPETGKWERQDFEKALS